MKQRVADGISAIPNERYRLLWDNLPIWYRVKWMSEKFAAHDACLVADTYTSAWCGQLQYMDEDNFLDSMAEAYTRIYLNIGVDEMIKIVLEMVDKYDVDGFVMHSNRSCKPYSLGQYDIQRAVREREGDSLCHDRVSHDRRAEFFREPGGNKNRRLMEMIKQKG